MNQLRFLACSALAAALVETVHAHPGHDPLAHGATHFIASPMHWLPFLAAAALLGAAAGLVRRPQVRIAFRLGAITSLMTGLAIFLSR